MAKSVGRAALRAIGSMTKRATHVAVEGARAREDMASAVACRMTRGEDADGAA